MHLLAQIVFIYLNLKLYLHAEKAAPAHLRVVCAPFVACHGPAPGPRAHSSAASVLPKIPNTKQTAKTTPGRDTQRGAPQRLRIIESDSSSSDEDDFVHHDRQSSTTTTHAGVRPDASSQTAANADTGAEYLCYQPN